MKRLQRLAVLSELTDRLKERGSWCGETHIQKAVYVLQELLEVPMEYDYVLYRHGPYSFDLHEELSGMQADGLVSLQSRMPPYGPSIVTTQVAEELKKRFPITLNRHGRAIRFVAQKLGDKGVIELERLATALYVTNTNQDEDASVKARARTLNALKPHVSLEDAQSAVEEMDQFAEEALEVCS